MGQVDIFSAKGTEKVGAVGTGAGLMDEAFKWETGLESIPHEEEEESIVMKKKNRSWWKIRIDLDEEEE